MDLDWGTHAREHSHTVEIFHYIFHPDTTRAVARASAPVVRDALKFSMDSLKRFGEGAPNLSNFLAANRKSVHKVILAKNPELHGCACIKLKDGHLKWGVDAMLLKLTETTEPETRLDYLQAAADFCGEVFLVGIELRESEAQLFWEKLRFSLTPPHSLHVYGRLYAEASELGKENLGSELLETVRENGRIKALTVAYADLDFIHLVAPIASLHTLTFIGVEVGVKFFEKMAAHIDEWASLMSLTFSHVTKHLDNFAQSQVPLVQHWQKSFASFVRTNCHHLKHLALEGFSLKQNEDHFLEFVTLLENNSSLLSLSLAHCLSNSSFLDRTLVIASLSDAIHKSELLYFDLNGTSFSDDPAIQAQLGRKKAKHHQILKSYEKVPATAVRLFICGDSYAGKTTLLESLSNDNNKNFRLRLSSGASRNTNKRTRGIEVRNLVKDGIRISAWDMAGQEEFHAFHDHIFPDMSAHGAPALFLFVWSPINSKDDGMGERKSAETFETSFRYWLKFIASKTRPSNVARKVIVVLTRKDQMNLVRDSVSTYLSIIQETFQMVIEIAGVWEVDARNYASVKVVASSVFECAKSVLRNVSVYKVCDELSTHLTSMGLSTMAWEEFQTLCRNKFTISEAKHQTAIALSLHESGHLIYFRNMPFLILDTNWFCCKVMGELIHFAGSSARTIPFSGFVPQQYLERLLEQGALSGVKERAARLVDLMEAMHLCCKVPGDALGSVFIPSTLSNHLGGARTFAGEPVSRMRVPSSFMLEGDCSAETRLSPSLHQGFFL